jgi:signal transduction histidine kinase
MVKPYATGEKKPPEIEMETVHEIQGALQTINKRSTGLMNFVETYRSLTKIPEPSFEVVPMMNLVHNVHMLMKKDVEKKDIELSMSLEPDTIELHIDEQMIEQVLINLVKNSVQALDRRKDGKIHLRGFYNKRGRPTIQVIDNGQGILGDVIDKIFIPFFTTKRSGSGIGLSLSRQILRLHGGTITAQSKPNEETIFTMTF